MNTILKTVCLTALFGLLTSVVTVASPTMEVASETSSINSVALNLQTYTSLLADDSESLDLIGLFSAWSEAVELTTCPVVGTLIIVF